LCLIPKEKTSSPNDFYYWKEKFKVFYEEELITPLMINLLDLEIWTILDY